MASGYPDWLRAVSMLGKYIDEYKVVAVTEEGNLYVLLQGEDADHVLHTVRLDDEGRLSAFIIDSTDAWNRMLTIGNAELAARLGSSVIYDRRGQVLFVESFERGWYRWTLDKDGANAAGEIVPTIAATGGYSVKLTGGSDETNFASIQRRIPSRPVGRTGLEFSFAVPAEWDYLVALLYLYTGALVYTFAVKFVYATGSLMVLDHDLDYVPVGVGAVLEGDWFNTIKVVADIDTGEYVRLMFNNQEIDISARSVLVDSETVTPPSILVDIILYSREGFNDVMYLDDIILTGAEP